MDILLATEIWGRTPHVDALANSLHPFAGRVMVADPYDGRDPCFPNETSAYAAYLEHCGHEEYARRVTLAAAEAAEPVFLVGFSAGAGAVWTAICTENLPVAGACCFYGSAIRNLSDTTPNAPVDLIFPDQEDHFDVAALADVLAAKPLTRCHRAGAGHGFMNPLSANYSPAEHRFWMDWLISKASRHARRLLP